MWSNSMVKYAASAGHGAQGGGVAQHFSQGHLGIDGGLAAFGIHTLYAGAAGVEVAHDVAHVCFRHGGWALS